MFRFPTLNRLRAQIPIILLPPLLAVAVLGTVTVAGRTHGPAARTGDASAESAYAPQAFSPRFTPMWAMLLRAQHRAVTRTGAAWREAHRADARAEYLLCLREYNRMTTFVPAGAFAGQALPHHIPTPPDLNQEEPQDNLLRPF